MKKFRRIVRRRVEAAFQVRMRPQPPVRPSMDRPHQSVPAEVIDLATGPFNDRFPELSARDDGE